MIQNSFLSRHIDLLQNDSNFNLLWGKQPKSKRTRLTQISSEIDDCVQRDGPNLLPQHELTWEVARKHFVLVQDYRHGLSKVTTDAWLKMLYERDHRDKVDLVAREMVATISDYIPSNIHSSFYGGLKPDDSIRRKIQEVRPRDGNLDFVIQPWDLIRYRIVVNSVQDILNLGINIWKNEIDQILRCRNYYFRPRADDPSDPYRALHFHILVDGLGFFELQIITIAKEVSGILDQNFIFKPDIKFLDDHHREWLHLFRIAANIMDIEKSQW
mgnify:CR=1 FL=1|jgi:hypothetical protein